jgi:hypothetical protein
MIESSVQRLSSLCDIVPPALFALDEATFGESISPGGWTKKQILGHLTDSATNNHHRFVRGQFEEVPRIAYDQNAWNAHSYYNEIDSRQLILFWEYYNRQLLALIQNIPAHLLTNTVDTGGPQPVTIAFLIEDYVVHLEHHLRQIVHY